MAEAVEKQELINEIKRLRRVNAQQAAGWKSTADQLRDANTYIKVLEDENEIFQQRISDLEGGE